ncbi:MAG: hypothetical protein FI687_01260 [SAR202 cluster bacterium]|nr:hypothetical protein [SAR202 cluster bacterium]|tara:strand:+ start:306 stop:521 length:216 start_codon:yes stop_codon:yes gene_type:complete
MENETEQQIECVHQWLIDSPNGPISKGECLDCGKISEFKNSMPVSGWDRTDNTKSNDKNSNDSKAEKPGKK